MYSRPYNKAYPVVCMDEKPIQFFADFRKGFRSKKTAYHMKIISISVMAQLASSFLLNRYQAGDMPMRRNAEPVRTGQSR